jgi:hypothetical protein
MAGIWGFPVGRESMLRKLEKSKRMSVATSFAQGLEQTAAAETTEPVRNLVL